MSFSANNSLIATSKSLLTLTWDHDAALPLSDGAGTWNYASNNWWNGTVLRPWLNGSPVIFGSPPNLVVQATISLSDNFAVGAITFSKSYIIDGFAITLLDPSITVSTLVSAQVGSIFSGSVGLAKNGSGSLALGGSNTFTGSVFINAGTLVVANNNALGNAGNSVFIANGARVQLSGSITTPNSFSIIGAGSTGTINNFNGTNTISGLVTLTGASTIGSSSGSTLIFLRSSGDSIVNGGFLLTVTGTGNTEIRSPISGSGGLSKTGSGTLSLFTTNTYTGTTSVTGGILNIQNSSALGSGTSGVTVSGQLQLQGGISVSDKQLTIEGQYTSDAGALRNVSGNNTWGGNILLAGATGQTAGIYCVADSLTLNGNITGDYPLVCTTDGASTIVLSGAVANSILSKRGTGTLTLSGSNTYTGSTSILAGTLVVSGSAITGDAASKITSASFTNTTLTVTFGTAPVAGETYRLFPGSTVQTYNSITLTGVGVSGINATYNSTNSTLTINGASGNVFHITYNGAAWVANPVASGDYVSVAGRSTSNSDAYAAKNGAGVDLISGGAVSSLGLSTNYKSLSALTNDTGFMWGANTSGGVDYLNYLGGWFSSPLVSGTYLSVSTNTNGNNNVYASKASGGVDWITYVGGGGTGWAASTLLSTSTVYVDIAPTYGTDAFMWAVTSTGAIAKIQYSGGWVETPIVSGNYLSVCNSGSNGFAYAARADGGIDYITYGTGWGASSLLASSTVYNDLAADLQGNGFLFATAVPPASTPTPISLWKAEYVNPIYHWTEFQ